jgi:hypothetical protein
MVVKRRNRAEKRLKVKGLDKLGPGVHEDGGGLRLVVEPSGARRWVLPSGPRSTRSMPNGKSRQNA